MSEPKTIRVLGSGGDYEDWPNPKYSATSSLAPSNCSAAALKARIARMRECRKWSSGHYSVHVDELLELLSILETIIERQEPPNE